MTSATLYESLSEPFDKNVLQKVNKGGASLTYVPVAEVIARLNRVLGFDAWSEESKVWRDATNPEWAIAHVRVTVTTADGTVTTKDGWGGHPVAMRKGTADPVDLGDAFKSAHSDAFKKACQKLGVALDIARKEDALDVEQQQLAEAKRANEPRVEPETMDSIKAMINGLSKEDKAKLGEWWKSESIPSLQRGPLTVDEARAVMDKLESFGGG